jgi:molybdopterin converting factor small subunit
MSQIRVRMFGAFRNLVPEGELQVEVPENLSVAGLKIVLGEKFSTFPSSYDVTRLLSNSVFANENRILKDFEKIHNEITLALLPPVSGG